MYDYKWMTILVQISEYNEKRDKMFLYIYL